MGRIRLPFFTPQPVLHNVEPARHEKAKEEPAEHVEDVEVKSEGITNSILPRTTKEDDLPFIPSRVVKKQGGKGGGRLWIVVDDIVLDVTEYQKKHPGGRQIISGFGGQDCSWQWWSFHNRSIWQSAAVGLRVGRTEGVPNQHERPPPIVGLRKHGFNDWD